jgi:hypothetical protein
MFPTCSNYYGNERDLLRTLNVLSCKGVWGNVGWWSLSTVYSNGGLDLSLKKKKSDQDTPKFDEDGVLINLPFAMTTMPCWHSLIPPLL